MHEKGWSQVAGASLGDVCKIHACTLHRVHHKAIYRAIGRDLQGTHPCATGPIVDGFAMPETLVETSESGRDRCGPGLNSRTATPF